MKVYSKHYVPIANFFFGCELYLNLIAWSSIFDVEIEILESIWSLYDLHNGIYPKFGSHFFIWFDQLFGEVPTENPKKWDENVAFFFHNSC